MNSIQIANISTLSDFIEGGNILMSEENTKKFMDTEQKEETKITSIRDLKGLGLGGDGSTEYFWGSTKEEDETNRKKVAAFLRKHCPDTAEKVIQREKLE